MGRTLQGPGVGAASPQLNAGPAVDGANAPLSASDERQRPHRARPPDPRMLRRLRPVVVPGGGTTDREWRGAPDSGHWKTRKALPGFGNGAVRVSGGFFSAKGSRVRIGQAP